jgi:hypothetical protein
MSTPFTGFIQSWLQPPLKGLHERDGGVPLIPGVNAWARGKFIHEARGKFIHEARRKFIHEARGKFIHEAREKFIYGV